MTEDDARTKWCPRVMVVAVQETGSCQAAIVTNRGDEFISDNDFNCVASDCMMWIPEWIPVNGRPMPEDIGGRCGLVK